MNISEQVSAKVVQDEVFFVIQYVKGDLNQGHYYFL